MMLYYVYIKCVYLVGGEGEALQIYALFPFFFCNFLQSKKHAVVYGSD